MKTDSKNKVKSTKKRKKLALRFLPLIAPFMFAAGPLSLASHASGTGTTTNAPVHIGYAGFQSSMHDLFDSMGLRTDSNVTLDDQELVRTSNNFYLGPNVRNGIRVGYVF